MSTPILPLMMILNRNAYGDHFFSLVQISYQRDHSICKNKLRTNSYARIENVTGITSSRLEFKKVYLKYYMLLNA